MPAPLRCGIDERTFQQISQDYAERCSVQLCAVTSDGEIVFQRGRCDRCEDAGDDCAEARAFAVSESLRWGEPSVTTCPGGGMLWAVPIMHNSRVLGGLVAAASEERVLSGLDGEPPLDIPRVCTELRELAEARNLTNAAALRLSRQRYADEQQRAHAIHAFKSDLHYSIRELYMREEPALMAAIRSGDRRAAREILNHLLMTVHYHARDRIEIVRSIFLELVVTMSRTAVEAGGDPEQFLGMNYELMTRVAEITSHEELAGWLRTMLEAIMEAIERNRRQDPGFLIFEALDFMEKHCCEDISRDDVAEKVHLSPSHFSRLFRRESGATFTDVLNRMRIDRAAEMLARTDRQIAMIALECGFRDQSYFTKVFKRYRNTTPLRYRKQTASGA